MPSMIGQPARSSVRHQWARLVASLLLVVLMLGQVGVVRGQVTGLPGSSSSNTSSSSSSSSSIALTQCQPGRCFSSAAARQEYATQNRCYFLEDVCTEFDRSKGNVAQEEDRGFWGSLWDAGVGAMEYGYDFVRGLFAGLGDQIKDLIDFASDPLEAARGLVELGKAFYDNPKKTLDSLATLIGQEAVNTIVRATQCGAYDLGRVIGQNVNPVVLLRVGQKLVRYGGKLDDAVLATRRELGCASFVAGTPVWLEGALSPIESINTGSLVLSRNEKSAADAPQKVTQTFTRTAPEIWTLRTEGEVYHLTGEHPVWVQSKGWVETKDLKADDVLATKTGDALVLGVSSENVSAKVFNFSVANTPSYFVGSHGLWVHNSKCDVVPGGGLSAHEGRGHTLERHVNVTTDDLRDRANSRGQYAGERSPPMSSRYADRATAENVIATVVADNHTEIETWLNNPASPATQGFDSKGPFNKPIGEGVPRGSEVAQPLSSARVVLRKDPSAPGGYFILTSYPQ